MNSGAGNGVGTRDPRTGNKECEFFGKKILVSFNLTLHQGIPGQRKTKTVPR
jgi:hypothetical protein